MKRISAGYLLGLQKCVTLTND